MLQLAMYENGSSWSLCNGTGIELGQFYSYSILIQKNMMFFTFTLPKHIDLWNKSGISMVTLVSSCWNKEGVHKNSCIKLKYSLYSTVQVIFHHIGGSGARGYLSSGEVRNEGGSVGTCLQCPEGTAHWPVPTLYISLWYGQGAHQRHQQVSSLYLWLGGIMNCDWSFFKYCTVLYIPRIVTENLTSVDELAKSVLYCTYISTTAELV